MLGCHSATLASTSLMFINFRPTRCESAPSCIASLMDRSRVLTVQHWWIWDMAWTLYYLCRLMMTKCFLSQQRIWANLVHIYMDVYLLAQLGFTPPMKARPIGLSRMHTNGPCTLLDCTPGPILHSYSILTTFNHTTTAPSTDRDTDLTGPSIISSPCSPLIIPLPTYISTPPLSTSWQSQMTPEVPTSSTRHSDLGPPMPVTQASLIHTHLL